MLQIRTSQTLYLQLVPEREKRGFGGDGLVEKGEIEHILI